MILVIRWTERLSLHEKYQTSYLMPSGLDQDAVVYAPSELSMLLIVQGARMYDPIGQSFRATEG